MKIAFSKKTNTRVGIYSLILLVSLLAVVLFWRYWFFPAPFLAVEAQTIQNGQLTIARVHLPRPANLLIYATKYGQPTEVVGRAELLRGRHKAVSIYVNVPKTTPQLLAGLYEMASSSQANPEVKLIYDGRPLKMLFDRR